MAMSVDYGGGGRIADLGAHTQPLANSQSQCCRPRRTLNKGSMLDTASNTHTHIVEPENANEDT